MQKFHRLLIIVVCTTVMMLCIGYMYVMPTYVIVENEKEITKIPLDTPTQARKTLVASPAASVVIEEQKLLELLSQNCEANIDNYMVRLQGYDAVLPMSKYKKELAKNFTKDNSYPPHMMGVPGILPPREHLVKPNPRPRLHNPEESINVAELEKHVEDSRQLRISQGDDDIFKIPGLASILQNSKTNIPNIVHFIWFGQNNRYRVDHFMAMVGVLKYQKPKMIMFHHDGVPVGEYWEEAKTRAGEVLKMVKRSQPATIFGFPIKAIEHRADVARLQIMIEVGGIYIDTDSIFLKSVDEFLNYEMVQSESDFAVLANGIIFANHTSWFLRRWYQEYKYFQQGWWGLNSVLVPWALSEYFPDKIHVVRGTMCRPSWEETPFIFQNKIVNLDSIYILHLYSRKMLELDGTVERTMKQLAVLDTTYGEVARHVFWGDTKIRDVTNWIVTCNLTRAIDVGNQM